MQSELLMHGWNCAAGYCGYDNGSMNMVTLQAIDDSVSVVALKLIVLYIVSHIK